ncbi:MAG: TonB-dependent receptor [Bacteroidota bacterium]
MNKHLSNHEFHLYDLRIVLLLLMWIGLNLTGSAQSTIKGNIVDADTGEPLIGATVLIKGTSNGTVTDIEGNYQLNAKPNSTLVIGFIGFTSQEILVNNRTQINVKLATDVEALEEVVIVGYGVQKKKEVTGAVVRVDSEELSQTTTADIGSALQGQIAGVNITSSSGAPGEEANIVIRGFSSLIDGQNQPLYVVDGIPFDSDPQLSISEIESIDVLKDAASASIYGTRGAGGVILITTKQGKPGQSIITVNSEYGVQRITSDFDNMTKEEATYLDIVRGAIRTDTPEGQVETDIHRNSSHFTNNTDITEVLLVDNAPIQNHSVNISGGNSALTYSFNTNYFEQGGVFFNSNYKRLNVRANSSFTKGKWKITSGLTMKRDNKQVPYSGMMNRIYQYRPFQPAISLDDDVLSNASEISTDEPRIDWQLGEARRLANTARLLKTDEQRRQTGFTGNLQFDFNPMKDLTLTTRFGGTTNESKWEDIIPRFDIFNTEGVLISNPNNVTSNTLTDISYNKVTSEFYANYSKSIDKHNFTVLAGTTFEKSQNERFQLEARNNLNPAIQVIDNYELLWNIESGGQDYTRVLLGNVGRVRYNYGGRYLFSASARYDGSSQFSQGNKWGFFPSVSVGWNISDEAFWSRTGGSIIETLKVRASYGTTGNDRFATYSNQTVVRAGSDYVFGSNSASDDVNGSPSESVALGTTQLAYSNANLRWETNIEQNVGIDFGFMRNKLTATIDIYKSEKQDLLLPVVNPPSSGVFGNNRSTIFNVGNMENRGFELAMKYSHKTTTGFSLNVSGTYTQNENVVTKTSESNPIININNSFISSAGTQELVSRIQEGYEAAAFFGRQTAGVIKTEEQLEAYRAIEPDARLGEMMYVDQNGDSAINDLDKVYLGSGTPDFTVGLNISVNYKNFDLSMQWYGSFGAEIMNGSKAYAYHVGTHRDLFYSWTDFNPNSDIPFFDGNNSKSYRGASDYFLEDGDFVRLRNIVFGYSLPNAFLKKMGIKTLRFYVRAQNPITFTKYRGFDPEVGGNGLSTLGIDRGRYPMSSQYLGGLQLKF